MAETTLVFHSAGGLVDPTLTTYGFLRALPCTINTHALAFVASAANVLFLAGEKRSANRNCRFLFHPTTAPITGSMSGGQLRDRMVQFDAVAASIAEIYRDRMTFTDQELARFGREEVIYTAQQAKAGGMVQEIKDLQITGRRQGADRVPGLTPYTKSRKGRPLASESHLARAARQPGRISRLTVR